MSRTLWDPVDRTQLGSLEPGLQVRVNGEVYRFCGRVTRARFRKDPVRWCGILRDPVTGVRFVPDRFSPRWNSPESPYFFSSDSTYQAFLLSPEKYEIHRR